MRRILSAVMGVLVILWSVQAFADTGEVGTDAGDAAGTDVAVDAGGDTAVGDVAADVSGDIGADVGADASGDTSTGDVQTDGGLDGGGMDVADTDMQMDAATDGGGDTAPEVGDAGDMDAADAEPGADADMDVQPDTEGDVEGPADTDGAADAAGDAGDAGGTFRFTGRVVIADRKDDSGAEVAVERTDVENGDAQESRQTTDADGRFVFEALPAGEYRVEVTLDGYVTRVDQLMLAGDRSAEYTLYRDQNAALEVVITFRDGAEVPSTVDPTLVGPRGEREPEEALEVTDGTAGWTVDSLPAGVWRLEVEADGFRRASVPFDLSGAEGTTSKLNLSLEMVPDSEVSVKVTDGCSCNDGNGSGGGAGGRLPSPVSTVIVVMLGAGIVRRARRSK